MLKTAPTPIDVQDLQFKLHCRLKVFDNAKSTDFARNCSLVACASRFGLIFVGTNTPSIQAILLKDVERVTPNDGDRSDYPRRVLPLPSPPLHVSVNCEHTILAVVVEKNNSPCALFYNIKSFYQQNLMQVGEVRLSPTPSVHVTEVNWNPTLAAVFTACKSDGTLGIYEIKTTGVDINELPAAAGATCFCWSPKGKQIAVGSRDGRIMQLKPDLKAVKVINAPPLKGPHVLKSLQWVSNYQFIGAFQPAGAEGQALFIVVDAPKTGDLTYVNYDDICYSNGCARPVQFYTVLVQSWNVLMAASSNSMEVGILGNSGEIWTQWSMGDASRAELPLSGNHQETLPIGCALDNGSMTPLPWGESMLPPTPLLLLFSDHGMLCIFNIVNLKGGVPSLCSPPDPIGDTSGLQHFVIGKENLAKEMPKLQPLITPQLPSVENQRVAPTAQTTNIVPNPAAMLKLQQQVPPSSQALNLSKPQTMNLFGGQATLTPIPQANKNAQPPLPPQHSSLLPPPQHSSLLPPPQHSSLLPPPQHSPYLPPPQHSSLLPNLLTNEIKTILSVPTVQPPTPAMPVPPVTKPAASAAPDLTRASHPEPNEDLTHTETSVDLKAEEEAERIFAQMLKEECVFLESELKAVLHQGRNLKVNLGSDEEKTGIVAITKALEDFFRDVVEICVSQNAEVHILKQNVLQSWAWYEEAKSRQSASEDASTIMLIRSQPLDSASEKQRADIQHSNYYLESQISQAHLALDEQWDNFQDYCKKTHKIRIPTMEIIFQTLVKQNAILRKQSYVLKDIGSRIKSKSRNAVGPSLLRNVDDLKDLPEELKRLRMNPEDISQIQHQHVTNRMKNFTQRKVDNLRSFLKKREYPHVSVIKPQISSSIIQTSPRSMLKQRSWATPRTPTAAKEVLFRKPDFVQSTPKATIPKSEPTPNIVSSTPIEGLQSFAHKFEAKHFSNLNDKTFTPLTKGVIASSPNSAFVSTSFGASTSASSSKPTFLGTASMSVAKATPSYVTVTTSPETSQPVLNISLNSLTKPVSFANSQDSVTVTPKPNSGVFAPTQTTGSFNVGAASASSVFGAPSTKAATPFFTVASTKPGSSVLSGFNVTPSARPEDGSTVKVSSTPSFSFGGSSSIFGSGTAKAEPVRTASSIFASGTTKNEPVSSTTSIFGPGTAKSESGSTTSGIFGSGTARSESSGTTSSIFASGTVKPEPVGTASSIFASGTTKSEPVSSTASIFGSGTTKAEFVSSSTSFFGSGHAKSESSGTTSSIFGSGTAKSESSGTTSSIFGAGTAKSESSGTTASIFGSGTAKSESSGTTSSIFGSGTAKSESSCITSSIFGSGTAKPESSGTTSSIFGSGTAKSESSCITSSIFGSGTAKSESSGTTSSIFGSGTAKPEPAVVTAKPLALVPKTTNVTTSQSLFAPKVGSINVIAAAKETSSVESVAPIASSLKGSAPIFTTQAFAAGAAPSVTVDPTVASTLPAPPFNVSGSRPSAPTATVAPAVASVAPSVTVATAATPTAAATASNIFGSQQLTTRSSIFGSANANVGSSDLASPSGGSSKPLFGGADTTPSKPSIFGGAAAASSATPTASVFGSDSSSTGFGTGATQSPLFGTTTTPTSSVFGATSSTSAGFDTVSTPATQSSIFGGTPSTSVAFGTATTTQPSASNIFGTIPTPTVQSPIFAPGQTTSAPLFGAATPSTTQSAFGGTSVFGSAATSTQSVFGQSSATPTTAQSQGYGMFADQSQKSSIFGGTTTTTAQPSAFGSGNQGSVFGGTTPSSSGSIFGQSQPSTTFGQSVFGSSGSTFGGSNAFGGSSQTFGQSGGSVFGGAPTTNSGSVFGGTPSTGGAFSSASVFGPPTSSASSPFGSSNIFSSNATQQQSTFPAKSGTGSFGFGGLSVGSTQPTTSSSGFGAAPPNPFGGENKNVFGGQPTSSASPAFGSNSGSLFGGPSQGGFGGGSFGSQPPFGQSAFGQSSFGNSSFGQSTAGPFSGGTSAGVGQTGFGTSSNFQKPAAGGFGSSQVFGGSPAFGSAPAFGGAPAFGNSPTFGGSPKVFGGATASPGFGAATPTAPSTGFGNLANQPTVGFGNLAQQQAASPGAGNAPFSGNSSFSSWR